MQRLIVTIGTEFERVHYQDDNFFDDIPQQNTDTVHVAAISVDGGRTQLRQEHAGVGVHNPSWAETKVGCLQVLESGKHTTDPHPDLPKVFKDRKSIKHMVEGLKGNRKTNSESPREVVDSTHRQSDICPQDKPLQKDSSYAPKVLKKLVIADMDHAESFGLAVYNKVHGYNLHTIERKAYLGDGDRKLWTIFEDNFRAEEWTPILDFVHAVEYAYDAAKLLTASKDQCWATYIDFITHIWQGRPLTVIRRLNKSIDELDSCKKIKSQNLLSKIDDLNSIRNYFKNNFTKMDYSTYRKDGLPISSCHVESLIKQFNMRIKASDKFWNKTSVKGILKIKSSLLSNDNSWNMFWNDRYDQQLTAKRSYQKSDLKMAA